MTSLEVDLYLKLDGGLPTQWPHPLTLEHDLGVEVGVICKVIEQMMKIGILDRETDGHVIH